MSKMIMSWMAAIAVLTIAMPAMAQGTNTTAGTNQPVQTNTPQIQQPSDGGVNWEGVGIGAGTVAGNVLYVPAKIVYGVLGGITGGASYLLTGGNTQTANTIWRSSLGGDYVLTPDMITGEKPIHFSGPTLTAPSTAAVPPVSSAAPISSTNGTSPTPPTRTASALAPLPASRLPSASAGAQPIDSGSGPVHTSSIPESYNPPSSPSHSSSSLGSAPAGSHSEGVVAPPLPSTSIE